MPIRPAKNPKRNQKFMLPKAMGKKSVELAPILADKGHNAPVIIRGKAKLTQGKSLVSPVNGGKKAKYMESIRIFKEKAIMGEAKVDSIGPIINAPKAKDRGRSISSSQDSLKKMEIGSASKNTPYITPPAAIAAKKVAGFNVQVVFA
jgi:hypothetical protein